MITPPLNKMLRYIVILFALTPCCWSAVSQANKCDDEIIRNMKEKFWNSGPPKDIIRTGMSWGNVPILMTTAGHYTNEEHINCVNVKFSTTSVDLFVKYVKSSTLQDVKDTFYITENDGVLVDKARRMLRYYLYSGESGVRPVYKCSETGKTGPPDGLIEVSEHGYTKEALDQSIKDLKSLGIVLNTKAFNNPCKA